MLLSILNGTARLMSSVHRPVALSGRFDSHGHDGVRRATVMVAPAAELRVRAKLTADGVVSNSAGEVVMAPDSTIPQIAMLAKSNDDVREVLDLLATSDLDWFGLYKIFEVSPCRSGRREAAEEAGEQA